MKYFILTSIALLASLSTNAQLILKEGSNTYLRGSNERLAEFVKHNGFDYALIGWSQALHTSERGSYSAVVRQNGNWYRANFIASSIDYSLPDKMVIEVKQTPFSKRDYKKLRKKLALGSAFKSNQSQFDALPNTCNIIYEGKQATAGSISDAPTWGLLEVDGQKVRSLSKYGTEEYLKLCAETDKRFQILSPFAFTVKELTSAKIQ